MKKALSGKILNIKNVAKETYELSFKSDLEKIDAGQFLSILCPPKTLRRPFGVYDFENGILKVLFRLKGDGTNYLRNLKEGDIIKFNAPLGHGFEIKGKKALLIGAGIGVAPLVYLNKKLKEQNIETKLICGFKEKEEAIEGCDFIKIGGTIIDEVEKNIKEFTPDIIYCCAPQIVLKLVSEIAIKHNIEVQVAMEKVMACGIGVCRGCIIQVKTKEGIENRSICGDGPVFRGDEVIWE
ncbi:MAG: hypothetical protein E7Z91_03305 [Cyanobacteria bacterium SIG30]|nr:hypothetical protein [Cyanobacteria bacterium SIG30]